MGTTSMCIIKIFWISEICIKVGHISDAVCVKSSISTLNLDTQQGAANIINVK